MNFIKYTYVFLCFFVATCFINAKEDQKIKVEVGARDIKKVSLVLITIGEYDRKSLNVVSEVIAKDLEFTGQFSVALSHKEVVPHKKEIKALEASGYSVAIFIEGDKKGRAFDIRMYDVKKAAMVTDRGYEVDKKSELPRGWGHAIADLVLEKLTKNKGFFSSKMCYCKQVAGDRQVCIADYDGAHEQVVARAHMLIAPRWNLDEDEPAIFYSKYTSTNIRLMKRDLVTGKQGAVASYEGLNMLPTFSFVRDEMILCLSCKGSNQLYSAVYNKKKKEYKFTQLTFNSGNNISPTLLDNGDIVFCSDFESSLPQLYKLIRATGDMTCMSGTDQVCFAPLYCPVNKKVAYSKMIDGTAQIFIYSILMGTEKQLTVDAGHKQEVTWSPCGNYLAYEFSLGNQKRIAIQSLLTGKRTFITSETDACRYPSWSLNFTIFPALI